MLSPKSNALALVQQVHETKTNDAVDQVPLAPRQKKSRASDPGIPHNFQVPTTFSATIDAKLKNPAAVFEEKEYSKIAREVAHAMKMHIPSLYPSDEDLKTAAKRLIEKYKLQDTVLGFTDKKQAKVASFIILSSTLLSCYQFVFSSAGSCVSK